MIEEYDGPKRDYLVIFQDGSKVEVEATSPEEACIFASGDKILRKPTSQNLKAEHCPATTVADVIEGELI